MSTPKQDRNVHTDRKNGNEQEHGLPEVGLDAASSKNASSSQVNEPRTGRVGSLSACERETIIRISDGEPEAAIWTAQRKEITALRKKPEATEAGSGFYGSTEWAEFKIPAGRWSTARGIRTKRGPMSQTQREQAVRNLAQSKQSKPVEVTA